MSCLNLTRLLPRTKLWKKLFKAKLPLKIHKLASSKAAKKRIQQQRRLSYNHKSHKKLSWSSLSIQPKRFKKKLHSSNNYKGRIYFNTKVPPPIYVDDLFVEPSMAIKSTMHERGIEAKVSKPSSSSSRSSSNISVNRGKNTKKTAISADDIWESLEMSSPQMDGIDERAEEFISRFRTEMQNQETRIARRL